MVGSLANDMNKDTCADASMDEFKISITSDGERSEV